MTSIWVVMGQTGEYSDRCEWAVGAFDSESAAGGFCAACEMDAEKLGVGRTKGRDVMAGVYDKLPAGRFDPWIRSDYTGTDYYVIEVRWMPGETPTTSTTRPTLLHSEGT